MVEIKEEINVIKERAQELVLKWLSGRESKVRGYEGIGLTILAIACDTLGIIYYSLAIREKRLKHNNERDIERIVNLWIDESIDKVLQLVPKSRINEENCKKEIREGIRELIESVGKKNMALKPDIFSNKLFNVLKKCYPEAGNRERELIKYIVRSERNKLNGLSQ